MSWKKNKFKVDIFKILSLKVKDLHLHLHYTDTFCIVNLYFKFYKPSNMITPFWQLHLSNFEYV